MKAKKFKDVTFLVKWDQKVLVQIAMQKKERDKKKPAINGLRYFRKQNGVFHLCIPSIICCIENLV